MKVWVTRAEPGASRTAERVRQLGFSALVAPLLAIRPLPPGTLPLGGAGALAFTSPNGVKAFSEAYRDRADARRLTAFAVGDATADAARAAGFAVVLSSGADAAALVELILKAYWEKPWTGTVLHLGAQKPAFDLAGALLAHGVRANTAALYTVVAAEPPSWLGREAVDLVLVHSPRAAFRLLDLHRPPLLSRTRLLCISEAAARPLRARFPTVEAASAPTEKALLALLGKPPPPG